MRSHILSEEIAFHCIDSRLDATMCRSKCFYEWELLGWPPFRRMVFFLSVVVFQCEPSAISRTCLTPRRLSVNDVGRFPQRKGLSQSFPWLGQLFPCLYEVDVILHRSDESDFHPSILRTKSIDWIRFEHLPHPHDLSHFLVGYPHCLLANWSCYRHRRVAKALVPRWWSVLHSFYTLDVAVYYGYMNLMRSWSLSILEYQGTRVFYVWHKLESVSVGFLPPNFKFSNWPNQLSW